MTSKRIAVRLVVEGGKVVKAELDGIGESGERSFDRIERSAGSMGAVVAKVTGILAGAFSVRQIAAYADTWTDLRSRVDLATGSQEQGAAVMERLATMARRTYSGLQQTAESWLANSTALRELGMSTRESLDFTEALNNAMVVSGARAERAEQIQRALSQAMALGVLRGDQLNTVIQNGGRVAELLAEELGVTVSQLRQLGPQGRITGDVIRRALVGNLELLREEAESMPETIGDAFTLLGNSALILVGTWDEFAGASNAVAKAIIALGDNLERLVAYAVPIAAFMGGRWVASFVAARIATLSLSAALGLLRTAMIRIGWGALIVGAGELVYWFGQVSRATGSTGTAFDMMRDVGVEAFERVVIAAQAAAHAMRAVAAAMRSVFLEAFADIVRAAAADFSAIASIVNPVLDLLGAAKIEVGGLGDIEKRLRTRAAAAAVVHDDEAWLAGDAMARATAPLASAAALADAVRAAGEDGEDALDGLVAAAERVDAALDGAAGGGGGRSRAAAAAREQADAAARVVEALQHELEQIERGAIARRVANELRAAEVGLYSEQGQAIAEMVIRLAALEERQRQVDAVNKLAAQSFADLFGSAIDGSKGLQNAVGDLLGQLGKLALNNGFLSLFQGSGFGASAFGGALGSIFTPPSYSGGGYTGDGARSGGLDGRGGFLALLHPRETVIDHARGQRMQASSMTFAPSIDARGADQAAVARLEARLAEMAESFRDMVQTAAGDPRMRGAF